MFQETQIRIQLETVEMERLNLERAVQHMKERVAQAVEIRQQCDKLHDEIAAQQKLLFDSRLELNITHQKMGLKSLLDFRKLVPRRSSQYVPPQDYAEDGGRHDNTKERKKQIKSFQHLPPVDSLGAAGRSTTLGFRPYTAGMNGNDDRTLHISQGTSATILPLSSPITQTSPSLLLDDKGQEEALEDETVQINAEDTVDEDHRGSSNASLTQQAHGTRRRAGATQREGKQHALARFRLIQKLNVHKTNAVGANQIDEEGVQVEPLHTFGTNIAMSVTEMAPPANADPGGISVEERPAVLEEGSQCETIQLERKAPNSTRSDSMDFHDTFECEDVGGGDASAGSLKSQLEQEVPEDAKLQRKVDTIPPPAVAESKETLLRRKQERKHKKAQDAEERRKLRLVERRQKQAKPRQNAPVPVAAAHMDAASMPAPQTQDAPVQTECREQKEPASVVAAAHREVATTPTPHTHQEYDKKMERRERANRMDEHRKQRKKLRKAKMLERSCQEEQKRHGCLPLQQEAILN